MTALANVNWVSPPGDTILNLLEFKQISVHTIEKKLELSLSDLNTLWTGELRITKGYAEALASIFGNSASFWLNRDKQYLEALNEKEESITNAWLKSLPIAEMKRLNWISSHQPLKDACLDFFGIKNVFEWKRRYYNKLSSVHFRRSTSFKNDSLSAITWIAKGEQLAKNQKVNSFSKDKLESNLYQIKALTRYKSPKVFLPKLTAYCNDCGVKLIILPSLKGCKVSGMARFLEDDSALIQLSFRYLSDDHFWFTFFHEAGHLIMHEKETLHIDTDNTYQDSLKEQEANEFSSAILIPHEMESDMYKLNSNKRRLIHFAMNAGISPGIVVGQMQKRNIIDYKYLNSYKRRYKWAEINEAINTIN